MQIAYSEDQITVVQSTASQLQVTPVQTTAGQMRVTLIPAPNVGALLVRLMATSTTSGSIKASAGSIYSLSLLNTTASVRYVHIYNATSITLGTTVPVASFGIPANGQLNWEAAYGFGAATGLYYAVTTDNASAPATAASSGDVVGTIIYD